MIIFSEEKHTYTHKETDNQLVGWTSVIKNYIKEFNEKDQIFLSAYKLYLGEEEYNKVVKNKFYKLYDLDQSKVAEYLKSKYPNDISSIVQELRYEWDYSSINGTKFHKHMEKESYERGYEISPFTEKQYQTIKIDKLHDNESISEDLFSLQDGYYPELLVWDNSVPQEEAIVTQIDKCFIETIEGIRYVDVDDYKALKKAPYQSKSNFMKAPLNGIYDNTVEKYKLQAMFGAKLMTTFGFTARYCAFTHHMNYDPNKYKIYLANYNDELMSNLLLDVYNNKYNIKPPKEVNP